MALNLKVVNMYSGGYIFLNVFYIVCPPFFVKLSSYWIVEHSMLSVFIKVSLMNNKILNDWISEIPIMQSKPLNWHLVADLGKSNLLKNLKIILYF